MTPMPPVQQQRPNVLELFAGIGGMSLGLERAGFNVVGQVEINPWCRRVLAKHWPDVPRHDDVRTALDWWLSEPRPPVRLVAGGYPCQPESLAGSRRGSADERWLWPDMARVVDVVRPDYVIGENVMGHRTSGLRFVLRDLEQLGYTARAGIVSAAQMGAPHERKRIFILAVANASGTGCGSGRSERGMETSQSEAFAWSSWLESVGRSGWPAEPDVGRVAYGVPGRVDRLRGLGNAVVPQVAEFVGRFLLSGQWLD